VDTSIFTQNATRRFIFHTAKSGLALNNQRQRITQSLVQITPAAAQ